MALSFNPEDLPVLGLDSHLAGGRCREHPAGGDPAALRLAAGVAARDQGREAHRRPRPGGRVGADPDRPARRADGAPHPAHRSPHRPSEPDQLSRRPCRGRRRRRHRDRAARGRGGDRPRRGVGRGARQPADLHHQHRLRRQPDRRPGASGVRAPARSERGRRGVRGAAGLADESGQPRAPLDRGRRRPARVLLASLAGDRCRGPSRVATSSGARPRRCCAISIVSCRPERPRSRMAAKPRQYDRPR